MVPSPLSGTVSHARLPHAAQSSLGGMVSSPHSRQRMPVSRPARTSAKKRCSVTTSSVTAEQAHEHGGGVAAKGVSEPGPGALDLPRPRFPAQLGDDLGDLGGAGGADGMALGLEPARRIDRDLAAHAGPALLGGHAARARL